MASYLWVRVKPPKDQDDARGLRRVALRVAPLRALLQDLQREGLGRALRPRSRPTGARSASRTCRSVRAVCDALTPKRVKARRDKSKQVTSLIEEFNYPKYGPGQMWEKCDRAGRRRRARRSSSTRTVTKVEHADGRAVAVDRRQQRRRPTATSAPTSSRRCRSARCCEAMDPPVPAEVQQAADDLRYRDYITVALVVPEEYGFPDNWIYIHDPDVEGRPRPELRLVVAVPGEGRPHLPRARVLRATRATRCGRSPTTDLVEQGKRELRAARPRRSRSKVEAGYVVRMPKAYPFYDAEYKANVDDAAPVARGAHAQRVSGRPQRHAPLQQPGPLDVHRDALGREHLRRRPRRLVGERRGGVPRREQRARRGLTSIAPGSHRDRHPSTAASTSKPRNRYTSRQMRLPYSWRTARRRVGVSSS